MDVKHLPKLRTSDGELRKRFLFVAIDRRSRSVHLAVKDDETEASAAAFLREVLAAFPFRVTRLLTDRGSCFTADGFEKLCRELGVEHRKTRPYTPRTNGMVERFNGRVQREVLGVTVAGHRDLERLLEGFNQAYNTRRQRVLDGRSPEEVVRERLAQDRGLANPGYRPPFDPCALPRAMLVMGRPRGGFQDSLATVALEPRRDRRPGAGSDRTTKPSRSPRSRCAGRRAGSAQGEALVCQEQGVAALDRPAPLARAPTRAAGRAWWSRGSAPDDPYRSRLRRSAS